MIRNRCDLNHEKQLTFQQRDLKKNWKYQMNALLKKNVKCMQKSYTISSQKIYANFWPKFLMWNVTWRMGSVCVSCSSPPPLASAFVGHPSLGSHFQSPWMRYQHRIPRWRLLLCCSPIARILFLRAQWEPSESRKYVRICADKT